MFASLAGALAACSGQPIQPGRGAPSKSSAADPCADLRALPQGFIVKGKLYRALETIDKANRICASSARDSWATELGLLVELGRYRRAHGRVDEIDGAKDAPAEAREAARKAKEALGKLEKAPADPEGAKAAATRLFEEGEALRSKGDPASLKAAVEKLSAAWDAVHPNGRALLSAGLAARALGDHAGAQRLLDRAAVEMEMAAARDLYLDGRSSSVGSFAADALAWAPKGDQLAVATGPNVLLFNPRSWNVERRLVHGEDVSSVAYSPDGSKIVSAALRTVYLWDAVTGREIRRLEGHELGVNGVAWSPDGKVVASGDNAMQMRLWDAESGALKLKVGSDRSFGSIMFSSDGARIVTGVTGSSGRALSALIWGNPPVDPLKFLWGHVGDVVAVFSPDGKSIVSGSSDRTVRLWSGTSGLPEKVLKGHSGGVVAVAFSPDGKQVASGSWDETLRLWDARSGDAQKVLSCEGGVRALAYSPDGARLVSATRSMVAVWDTSAWSMVESLGEPSPLISAAFSPDGKELASGGKDGIIRLWPLTGGGAIRFFKDPAGGVADVAYLSGGKELVAASDDHSIRVWDTASGKVARTCTGHEGRVTGLAISADGRSVISGSADKTVRVWEAATCKEVKVLKGAQHQIQAVAISADGARVAAIQRYGSMSVWDASTGAVLQTAGPSRLDRARLSFSDDGKELFVTDAPRAERWDLASGKLVDRADDTEEKLRAFNRSPDGKLAASVDGAGNIHLLPAGRFTTIARLAAPRGKEAGTVSADASVDFLGPDACAARALFACRLGEELLPFDLCEERSRVKGLLGKVVAGVSYGLPEHEGEPLACPPAPP